MNSTLLALSQWGLNVAYLFLIAVFIIEVALYYLNLAPRQKAIIRFLALPIALIDPFKVSHYLNPLMCESCIQKIMLYFLPTLRSYLYENEISFGRHLFEAMPQLLANVATSFLVLITAYSVLRHFVSLKHSLNLLDHALQNSLPCTRRITNQALRKIIEDKNIEIRTSTTISTPLAAYNKHIVIPEALVRSFSDEEFEAVISHELEHLIWKDPLTKCVLHTLAAFFWWLPSHTWLSKIDYEVERACDLSIQKYQISTFSLASAMMHLLQTPQRKLHPIFAALTGTLGRVQSLLDPTSFPKMNILPYLIFGSVLLLLAALCFCL